MKGRNLAIDRLIGCKPDETVSCCDGGAKATIRCRPWCRWFIVILVPSEQALQSIILYLTDGPPQVLGCET